MADSAISGTVGGALGAAPGAIGGGDCGCNQ